LDIKQKLLLYCFYLYFIILLMTM